ncbi:uncharacterized protein SPSC_00562 [Sporisorium scitamineum]|uniref:NADAR domain-containing protein n=1 Tax=Sporisorium scitamineum TaxID=49012 RepID=A0A0F7S348_9BASI|nr:hypothetical protein [Sporisorium scitamineum]CDU21932.1 uncharacterized protein SPSC_00562 [Sporisorium scitamineum]
MSTAAVSTPYPTEGQVGTSKRRSLFKPSTWKYSKSAHSVPDAGLEAPNGQHGLQTLDGTETGAPLTTLVAGEEHPNNTNQGESNDNSAAQPTTTAAATTDGAEGEPSPGSGLATIPDSLGRVTFFRVDQPNFHLSNSSPHPVTFNSIRYPTAEHLFQSLKFLPSHPTIASKVRRAKTPLDAMRIARSHTSSYNAGWISQGVNVKVMHQVVLAKFSQYSALAEALLETEEREIVNDSPTDVFWGIGGSGGRGRNVLGKTLMDVREVLRQNSGVGWGSAAKTM